MIYVLAGYGALMFVTFMFFIEALESPFVPLGNRYGWRFVHWAERGYDRVIITPSGGRRDTVGLLKSTTLFHANPKCEYPEKFQEACSIIYGTGKLKNSDGIDDRDRFLVNATVKW